MTTRNDSKPITPILMTLIQARMLVCREMEQLPPFSVRAQACQAEVEQLTMMIRARGHA